MAPEKSSVESELRPGTLEWCAWAAVLVAFVAHGLIRVPCDDIGSHMATARLAHETGVWPVVNTFSYPFRDFPLYCQYPVFESILYAVYRIGSWGGLSVLLCLWWGAVFLLFMRWTGRFRLAVTLHLPWMIGLWALQRRMMLRPEMVSMLLLACSLFVIDEYLRGRRWVVALLPIIHLAWVNAHQLFPVSLSVQALLVVHIWLSRRGGFGIDKADAPAPLWPAVAAFAGSIVATFFTPLGWDIVRVTAWTADTLQSHRHHVQEFAYIWDSPFELQLVIFCAIPAFAALWIGRHRWKPLEVGLLLMALALVLAAMRGIVFFSLVSIGFFVRTIARQPVGKFAPLFRRPIVLWTFRVTAAAITFMSAGNIVYHRWVAPPAVIGGTQPGLGRTRGDWPDAAIAALKTDPPPGRMMNMPWSISSPLIWFAPELPTFVDARFETFPRSFLLDAIHSMDDDAVLDRLIRTHGPTWIFAQHCLPNVRARLRRLIDRGQWVPTYTDARIAVLVRRTAETASYIRAHSMTVPYPDKMPKDLLPGPTALRRQQLDCYAQALQALGLSQAGATRTDGRTPEPQTAR